MVQTSRVALITGGGTGIGAATAKRFASLRTAVAVVGRRSEPLDETVHMIQSNGGDAFAIPADLADPGKPQLIVESVIEVYGRLDVLVNNAAAINHMPFDKATLEVFEYHMAVNVRAPYFLTQAALPHLQQSESPVVINVSSVSGALAIPGQSMYGMSKAALEYQTRSLATELAPKGIRVNAIEPGPVDTPIHLTWAADDVEGAYERMTRTVPLRRMGTAEELAACIVWLASNEASWLTGVIIPVDGGQTIPGANFQIVK